MNELISSVPWWTWIGTVIVVATLVFKVGSWKGKVDTTLDGHDEELSGFRDEFKEVRAEIQKLTNAFIRAHLIPPPGSTVSEGSPLQLTALGKKISKKINAPSLAAVHVAKLQEQAEGKRDYDIQFLGFDFIHNKYQPAPEVDEELKQCAFDNGLALRYVLDVLAIQLRDQLMKLAKEREVS